MSGLLGPLLLKSRRVWGWLVPKTFQGLHFLFSGSLSWCYLPVKRIWRKRAVWSCSPTLTRRISSFAQNWTSNTKSDKFEIQINTFGTRIGLTIDVKFKFRRFNFPTPRRYTFSKREEKIVKLLGWIAITLQLHEICTFENEDSTIVRT